MRSNPIHLDITNNENLGDNVFLLSGIARYIDPQNGKSIQVNIVVKVSGVNDGSVTDDIHEEISILLRGLNIQDGHTYNLEIKLDDI